MPNVTPRATASPCGSHDAPTPTAAAGDGSGHVLVAAAARAQHGGRETIAPFSHPFRTFIRPVPLPPPLRLDSSPLFIYGFIFRELTFPPSTARAPLYWLFFTALFFINTRDLIPIQAIRKPSIRYGKGIELYSSLRVERPGPTAGAALSRLLGTLALSSAYGRGSRLPS